MPAIFRGVEDAAPPTIKETLMKKLIALLGLLSIFLWGCTPAKTADIAATTLPVYEFTARLCDGTGLAVTRLVTESVSCLHDYSLNVRQVRAVESADLMIQSGAGLEDFMADILAGKDTVDASAGIDLLESCHGHDHQGHHHEADAHIWLSPENAAAMVQNICTGLSRKYPQYQDVFERNLVELLADIEALHAYGEANLAQLSQREIITFHDGFSYLARSCGLEILKAMEEESGSEASAAELKEIIGIVRAHNIKAIFVEANGSTAAAATIAAETGATVYTLDMAMSGRSWFDAMYHNIDTLKEALE